MTTKQYTTSAAVPMRDPSRRTRTTITHIPTLFVDDDSHDGDASSSDGSEPEWLPHHSTPSPPPKPFRLPSDAKPDYGLLSPSPILTTTKDKEKKKRPRKKRPVTEEAKEKQAERRRDRAAAKMEADIKALRTRLVTGLKVTSQAWDVLPHLSSTDEDPGDSDGSVQSYIFTDEDDIHSYKSRHMRRCVPSNFRKVKPSELLDTDLFDGADEPAVQVLQPDVVKLLRSRPCEILTCTLPSRHATQDEPCTLILPCRHAIHVQHLLEPSCSLWHDPVDLEDTATVSRLPKACWVCGLAVQDILVIVYVAGKPMAASVNDENLHMSIFTGVSLDSHLRDIWEKNKKVLPPKKKKK